MAKYDLTNEATQALTIAATVMIDFKAKGILLPEDQERLDAVQDELDRRHPFRAGWGVQARV